MSGEPREFGSYRLVRRLGVGGMAETFEAARAGTGGFEQRVCLKRVLPAYSHDPEFIGRFHREAKLAAQLRHGNIVGVTDFGEVEGVSYMALELVDGVDLRSLLRSLADEKLPPEMVVLIGLDLAYALEHAHQSIIHRDVSPANVLISRAGETKLADFGIAKAIESAAATASKIVQGKIPYMSPEQMRGEAVDARSDLFSLGVVLFEAVAGVRPFDGAHDVETMQRIVEGQRRSLSETAPDLPIELQAVIDGLIATDPEDRTPSASRLVEELAVLAPTPQVRRELASMVETQRGGPSTRMHVRARGEDPDTELSRAQELPSPAGFDENPNKGTRRGLRAALALLTVIALAAGIAATESFGLFGSSGIHQPAANAPDTVAPTTPTDPVEVAARAAIRIEDSAPTTSKDEDTVDPVPPVAVPSRGWIHVVVQPWGNVWIDGVWMGRAPVKARVAKGRHTVEVGRDLPSKKQVVKVEAGARKELEISLSD
ncbi:MAG: protein kinase [Myxococcales bacterium]|nr:protein kinase [Myxococcales bacterium]MDH3482897.1 protein kinase [Myxococcales bacterium]